MRKYYLNESICISLYEGTLDELEVSLKEYKFDRRYLSTYISMQEEECEEDILTESEIKILEHVLFDEDNKEEEVKEEYIKIDEMEIDKLDKDEGIVEGKPLEINEQLNEELNLDEGIDRVPKDKSEEVYSEDIPSLEDHNIENLANDEKQEVPKDDMSEDKPDNDILIQYKAITDDIDINQLDQQCKDRDVCKQITNNFNTYLPPSNEYPCSLTIDPLQGYNYSSLMPYEEDYPPLAPKIEEKVNEELKPKTPEQEHEELEKEVKSLEENFEPQESLPKKNEDNAFIESNIIQDQIPEDKSEKDILFKKDIHNINDNNFTIFKLDEKKQEQTTEINFDDLIDNVLNETTIINNPKRKDLSSLDLDERTPKNKRSKKTFEDTSYLDLESESIISKTKKDEKKSSKKLDKLKPEPTECK
jgi:hypothetical protein